MQYRSKLLPFCILLFSFTNQVAAQKLDSLKNWRIHKLVDREAFNIPEDSLHNIPSRLLPREFVDELRRLQTIDTNEPLALQTAYLLSFEDSNGRIRKVLACGVGNYIFIDRFQKYWSIYQGNRENWLEIIHGEYRRIP